MVGADHLQANLTRLAGKVDRGAEMRHRKREKGRFFHVVKTGIEKEGDFQFRTRQKHVFFCLLKLSLKSDKISTCYKDIYTLHFSKSGKFTVYRYCLKPCIILENKYWKIIVLENNWKIID